MLGLSLDLSSEVFARLGQVFPGALSSYLLQLKYWGGNEKDPAAADVAGSWVLSAHPGAGVARNHPASAPSLPFSSAAPQATHL